MSNDTSASAIIRKKNTGEAGNGGEFGHVARPEADISLAAAQPMPAVMDRVKYRSRDAVVVHVDDRTAVLKYENGELGIVSDKDLGLDQPAMAPIGSIGHLLDNIDDLAGERAAAAAKRRRKDVDLPETLRRRRGHIFYPKAEMRRWPALYETEGTRVGDKKVVAHYFSADTDWYIVEADPATGRAFGYTATAHSDSEWGYIDLPELERTMRGPFVCVERDCHFTARTARELLPRNAWAYAD